MQNQKCTNNPKSNDITYNSFTRKKEEKPYSRISIAEPIFQPMAFKSGYSNKFIIIIHIVFQVVCH